MSKARKARPRVNLNHMQKEYAQQEVTKYFNKLLDRKADEWKCQIMLDDRRLLTSLVFLVLHDKFGFGEKRLKRFDDCITEKMKDILDGYLIAKDIFEWFEEELGMSFDLETDNPAGSIVKE